LRPRKKKKVEISDEVMTTENKVPHDNSTLSPYQIALKKSIWYFFSNVISWFSSKVHKQSVVMNFVLDENDLEVNLL
jgi:murein L,D-transpeptidase YafK